jgi:hypothetical protein
VSPTLSWGIMTLVAAAILIALWVWWRQQERTYLNDMARFVRNAGTATDPWEEPQIVATYGGIYDAVENGDFE